MKEMWKKIENYNDYEISNLGNIKSLKNGIQKILKPSKSSSGYLQIVLCKNGKTKCHFIHKLVAKAFIENDILFYHFYTKQFVNILMNF